MTKFWSAGTYSKSQFNEIQYHWDHGVAFVISSTLKYYKRINIRNFAGKQRVFITIPTWLPKIEKKVTVPIWN